MQSNVQQITNTEELTKAPASGNGSRNTEGSVTFERFLEGISEFGHGLRNSLTVIRGSSELLMESSSDEARAFAEMVHDESTHLDRLSQDLLDFSRLERKKFNLTPRWIDLPYLIHQASAEASALAGNRTIDVRIQEGLPSVYADSNSIQQVILNLLIHLIERSPEQSTVAVTASLGPETADAIAVSVHSPELALSAAELTHIFEPFSIHYPTASHGKRTWLGLAISKSIIESQGGVISASSADGAGATFTFSLPAANWAPEENELED
jgi:signal transduction histidine kinase